MKSFIALCGLFFCLSSAHALDLTLGMAWCYSGGDYCDPPLGHFALGQDLYKLNNLSLRLNADHYSRLSDGFNGTPGLSTIGLDLRYTFPFWKY